MVVLLVAALGLIVAAALAFWPCHTDGPGRGRKTGRKTEDQTTAGYAHPEPWIPSSLEGVLATQLIGGAISRAQYLRALEQIAARDEQRHPLAIPRDESPGTRP